MLEAIKDFLRPLVRPPLHRPEMQLGYEILGTRYGAWPLSDRPRSSVILSFGVGEDVSFDLAAIERGNTVHAFDPTPKSGAWIAQQRLPKGFIFHPWGLAAQDGMATFHAPVDPAHVSYSAQAVEAHSGDTVTVPVFRLQTIMDRLKLAEIDTLKMDIEGFEYGVIDDLVANGPLPQELLIEFHHSMYGYANAVTERAVEQLRSVGYRLYYVASSGQEYAFIRTPAQQ